jgi:hypothetical protein
MFRDPGGAINVADAFRHTVRVASLAPFDYKSVKYKSKLTEPCLLLRRASYDSRICWAGFLVTPSKCDGDGGTRALENEKNELCRVLEKRISPHLTKETYCILWNSKVHCRVYNTQHVGTMLSQMNPSHTLEPSLRYSLVV